ncbi:MAG: PAS domain S-box protein [Candidatus Marinimicrobia bacterium]|nr:PAS domain S-box protein [Candidatus Neomarinimicrobiota bacterium]
MARKEDIVLSVIKSRTDKRDLKKAKDLLKESQDLYRRLFESSRDAIYITDTDGKFVDINPAFNDLFGYSKEETKELTGLDFHVDPRNRLDMLYGIRKNDFVKDFEVKLRKSNGAIVDCLISANARTSQDGIIIGYQGIIHDVTEQKIIGRDLIRSEKKYRQLFENSADAVLIIEDKSIIDCNQATVEMLGYPDKHEFLNTHPSELSPELQPDGRKSFEKADEMMKIALEKGSHRFEWDHKKSNGEIFPVEVLLTAVAVSGKKQILHTVWRDITERKIAEEAIKDANEKFRSVVQTAPNAIITANIDGNIIFWNNSAESIFGYTSEEAIGRPLTFIVPQRMREEHLRLRRSILKTESTTKRNPVRMIGLRKDESEFPLELSLAKWHLKGETFFTAIIQDITDIELKDEMLRKLSYAIDQSSNSVVITDTGGNIEYVNPKFENMTGYTFDEVKGKTPSVLKSGETSPEEYEKLWKTISSGKVWTGEFHNKRKNGELYWERASISPIKNESGVITHYLAIKEDITGRKRVEERLQKEHELVFEANKELRKAFAKEEKLRSALTNAEKLASLGEMASKIAHEINNPLTVIKAQAEIRAQMVTDEALKESLLMIKRKADQIKDLTRGYMNLAKPEEVELTNIKLQDVLKTTVRTLLPLGQLKHIKISEEYMKDEPSIFGDPGRLEQVFRNLIINAVDATSEKSSREIKIGTKLSVDGKSVDAYVKDNGVGIETEDIEKIFEPYYTKKERTAGTGLGLVIVKETTENVHGGKIKVESNVGEGTTFHVMIPSLKYSQMRKKLLIVDDDLSISELLAQYFSHKGLEVETAENGTIALDTIKKFKPDLILSDIEMPELDGFGLVNEARKMNPEQPIIMMTGFDDRAKASEPLNKIDIPLIMKPPDLEDELWPLIKEKLGIA